MPLNQFPATLVEALEHSSQGNHAITYLTSNASQKERVAYEDLPARAGRVLFQLQEKGLQAGDELILFVSKPVQFVDAFWACLLGGIVAVPVARGVADTHWQRLANVIDILERPFLYIDEADFSRFETYLNQHEAVPRFAQLDSHCVLMKPLSETAPIGKSQPVESGQTAFVQFSSGSTGIPKGVVLTHRNLLVNIRSILINSNSGEQDRSLSWMPLTHDMGLIGCHLSSMVGNVSQWIMPTELFARQPLTWLKYLSEVKATATASPNFGFRHVLKALRGKQLDNLDLSSLRLIFNGAEPISAALCREFMQAMKPFGLSEYAMFPVYGLAEASLAVAFPGPEKPLQTVWVKRDSLHLGQTIEMVSVDANNGLELVHVGCPLDDSEVKLVNDAGSVVEEQQLGRILIRGENVTAGYYADPENKLAEFAGDGWLDTGDLGFWHHEQLVITGRVKELIIVNGQNYHPHDLEAVCEQLPGIDNGKIAACGVYDAVEGTELLVMFVLFRGSVEQFASKATAIRGLLAEQMGLSVGPVIPVKQIPKTTSGKIQRVQLAEQYQRGEFQSVIAQLNPVDASDPEVSDDTDSCSIRDTLLAVCNELITGQTVSVDDNLFELGISSLTLAQIHERLDQCFPGQLDVTDLFDYPTILALEGFLENGQG